MKKLVLIDSNALVHRAFHALPPLNAPDGTPSNAVYGFMSVLLKMITDLKPDYIAATFDMAGPTFRHEEYKEYKAHREKAPDELYVQIPPIKDFLATMGIPVYERKGFEADDVIGSIAELTGAMPNVQTIIVTGDLDTLQLVQADKVIVFTQRKGMTDIVIYDEHALRERYGISPSQVADFKGLKGDQSDNIKGVPGIGEKTAISLIQEFGSIDELYRAIGAGTKRKPLTEKLIAKLVEHKDDALFSKKLATIVRDVDVGFDLNKAQWPAHVDAAALEAKCKQFGFNTLVKRLPVVLGAAHEQSLNFDGAQVLAPPDTIVDKLPEGDTVAVHLTNATLFVTADGITVYEVKTPEQVFKRYTKVIGHNLKPLVKLAPSGTARLFDTQIAAWLISPDQRDHSLERIVYDLTQENLSIHQSQWALAIWRIAPLLEKKLKAINEAGLFKDLEMPLIPILAGMERTGILVDAPTIQELATLAAKEVASLETKIYKLAGGEFNINSPAQLSDVLFIKLNVRGKVRRTGKGALSTAASELEKLRDEHPIVELVMEYRELAKLKSTYIDPFPALIAPDGRVHTTYNQTGAATGRMSSSDPNLQNIPTRTELGTRFRGAFIAAPGWKLLSLDYSQIELRIVAHIANDETMIEAFRRGDDIHTLTASEVFGVAPAQVTRDMRRQAKVLNFGIIYGMGTLGFARAAGISRDLAKQFIDEYFKRFSGVAKSMEATKAGAFRDGYVSTLLGRRRPLPDITSTMPQLQATAERMAINHPIQGTGADLVKLAMIAVNHHIGAKKLDDRIHLLLQVHDELVFEVRDDTLDRAVKELPTLMEHVYPLRVPLVVDAKSGPTWADMKPHSHA